MLVPGTGVGPAEPAKSLVVWKVSSLGSLLTLHCTLSSEWSAELLPGAGRCDRQSIGFGIPIGEKRVRKIKVR